MTWAIGPAGVGVLILVTWVVGLVNNIDLFVPTSVRAANDTAVTSVFDPVGVPAVAVGDVTAGPWPLAFTAAIVKV